MSRVRGDSEGQPFDIKPKNSATRSGKLDFVQSFGPLLNALATVSDCRTV